MTNRRNFIKQMAAMGTATVMPSLLHSQKNLCPEEKTVVSKSAGMIWANLLHLSSNMWEEHPYIKKESGWADIPEDEIYKDDYQCKTCREAIVWGLRGYRTSLVFDETVWDNILRHMARAGMNMVIIDLGDAIQYESHPEIAINGAWSVDKLRSEIAKMRKMGLEPIPKLNFATAHDAWMGEYGKMVSTNKYYSVCRDLISEVIEIFDTPRFFHLGMDEETEAQQRTYNHIVIRQNDLWWSDFHFYVNEVERKGVRSWIWSDYGWCHPDLFFKKMPKSVLQSNWYYGSEFDLEKLKNAGSGESTYVKFYNDLEAYGYDQVPTGSNWSNDTNMEDTVKYCKKNISPSRLLGFMTASWAPTMDLCMERHRDAVDQIYRAIKNY